MLRTRTVLALVAVLGLGMMTADAFGQCSKSKTAAVAAKSTTCGQSEFPTLKVMVGDKEFGCPMSAEKVAKESNAKIIYVVAGEEYGCRQSATKALADASEDYVKKFTTIACVVDGKVIYCDEKSSCSSEAKGKTVSASSTCCKSQNAKLAKADGCCSSKAKTTTLVKDDGRSDEGKTATCSSGDKAKLAKADDKPASCSKGDEAKLVKAEGASACCKSKTAKVVKADEDKSATCGKSDKAKLVKADGCCSSKAKTAKQVKAEGASGCCKSKTAKVAKVAKSDEGESCPLSKLAKLASSACCKDAKNVKYLVAGRTYDKREDAERARDAAVAAVKTVSMKYVVDGKEYNCSSQVCPSAMKAGKVKYVVNDAETKCDVMARVNLAKAQYDAAKGATVKLAKL